MCARFRRAARGATPDLDEEAVPVRAGPWLPRRRGLGLGFRPVGSSTVTTPPDSRRRAAAARRPRRSRARARSRRTGEPPFASSATTCGRPRTAEITEPWIRHPARSRSAPERRRRGSRTSRLGVGRVVVAVERPLAQVAAGKVHPEQPPRERDRLDGVALLVSSQWVLRPSFETPRVARFRHRRAVAVTGREPRRTERHTSNALLAPCRGGHRAALKRLPRRREKRRDSPSASNRLTIAERYSRTVSRP